MPSRKRGRHRAPRQPISKSTVAVPVVLLAASGGAFAGLAGVPAVTGEQTVRAAAASDVTPLPLAASRNTYAKDLDGPDAKAARAQAAALAMQRARVAAAERASRSRRAALAAQAEAAAAKKAAAEEKAAAKERARLRSLYVRPSGGALTSDYGPRWGRLHAGLDFGAAYGSRIRSVAAGEVVDAGYNSGYGNYVHVQHADGTVTTYNHMSRILRRGGAVDPGDVLGLVGSTGNSTGPHLHFEVRVGGEPINPMPWLRRHGVEV